MSFVADASPAPLAAPSTAPVRLAPSAVTAAIFLGLMLVLVSGSTLLADPDTQWHIAVGRWIVAHRALPSTDVFSYTYAGAPWIAKEWVSQLILFAAYAVGGWNGVVAFVAIVIAGTFAGLHAWMSPRMRPLGALTLTLAAFALCELHMLARPHALVMPIIVAWMIVLVRALERGTAPRLPAVLLMVAWVNMHGSFPLGLVMAGVLAGEGVTFAPRADRLRVAAGWALFLALSTAATMLSPFGWSAILVPLKMFGNGETLRFVNEWRPIGFDFIGIIAVAALVATLALLALDVRRNAFRLLLAALLAYLMVKHVRFVSLFGLACPILLARTMAERMPYPRDGIWINPLRRHVLAGLIACCGLAVAGLVTLYRPLPYASVTPQAAYDAAIAHGVHGHVYNHYDFGGFLIAHGVPTYVDGRTDQLFLGSFLADHDAAIDAKDDVAFSSLLDRAGATWALVRVNTKTTAHLDRMPGWRKLHADDVAAVYVRR